MTATDRAEILTADADPPAETEGRQADETAAWDWLVGGSAVADPLAGCLETLAALLGRPVSSGALAAALPLEQGRLTPALAVRALERQGFEAKIVRRPLGAIAEPTLPCLLFLDGREACLLVARRPGNRALIARPETGRGEIEVDLAELEGRYAGHALLAKPALRLEHDRGAAASREASWFWGPIRAAWPIYSEVALAALLINLFALASPLFVMNVYDRVVPNQAIETLWALAIGVVTVFVFDFILRNLRGYFVDSAGKIADIKLASRIYEQMLGLKMAARPGSAGAFASNLREFESLRDFFTSASLVAVIDLPFIFLFVSIVWLIGGPIALVPAVAIPIVIAAGLLLQLPLKRIMRRSFKEAAQKHGFLVESINGLETIKALGAEGRSQRLYEQAVDATAHSGTRARLIAALGVNLSALAQNLTTAGIVIYGVHRIGEGLLTVGALVACTIITGRAMAPRAQVAGVLTRYHQARSAYQALCDVMRLPVERPATARFLHRPPVKGDVAFKNVGFTYPDQKLPALADVSFRIEAGERVALIGRVGSGKTTIEKLLLGLFEPEQGTVLLDGTDLRQIDPADLRRQIGAVLQDVVLFQGTLRDNIALGAVHADDQTILDAARIAGVEAFAASHPMGFDLSVGERGDRLSGGQRQAVAIARALVNDPPILLLDEPTSAMDNSAEARFKQQLEAILPGKTLILVTHRTSLLSLVDRLIVMDGGRVVADGPKADVLAALAAGQIRGQA
jgi:ATP-binding cassette subfamily C protein LapB